MQIIEVRNDILKLAYSPFQNGLLLSDFLLVTEGKKSILAQVIGIESSQEKDINIAILKGCLSVDETGKINPYIGFTPSTGAEISPVSQSQVITMLCTAQNPVIWGYLAQHDNILFKSEPGILHNKPLILMDDYENYNVITSNIVYANRTHGEKTVIVDFDGSLKIDNAFYIKLGEDLKLPLSFSTLDYIYENDLKAESLSTQAVVQDIIIELQEYIKSLPEGFLPFTTIKNVIYSQYEANRIPELMLFKNKFVKYAQQELFAETSQDFDFLNEAIEENSLIVLDATELEPIWHKLLLNYLAKEIKAKCTFITKLENDNSDKKTILDIYNNRIINPVLVANYQHQFTNVMKSIAKNLILFPPTKQINDFATYDSFIRKLNRDEYVICGEDTLYLSFILRLTYVDTNMCPDYIEKEIQEDVDKLYRAGAKKTQTQSSQKDSYDTTPAVSAPEYQTTSAQVEYEQTDDLSDLSQEDEELTEEDLDFIEELDNISETDEEYNDDIQPAYTTYENEYISPNTKDNEEELQQDSENYLDEYSAKEEVTEEVTEEVIEDTDQEAVDEEYNYTTEDENDDTSEYITQGPISEEEEEQEAQEPYYNEESYEEPLEDESTQESPVQEAEAIQEKEFDKNIHQAPPIPVYSVPELEVETPAEFTEGNFVFHEKYGKGVIEKIMNYGSKTLCSIQFEEVGRRLLDPNLAGLKQI